MLLFLNLKKSRLSKLSQSQEEKKNNLLQEIDKVAPYVQFQNAVFHVMLKSYLVESFTVFPKCHFVPLTGIVFRAQFQNAVW